MAPQETNRDYESIERPYNTSLYRSDPNLYNGNVETMPVKSDGSMGDVWIKNFIKSENWQPKTVGFYINGQTGYAEFTNVFVSGNIQALTGTIGGFTIGATSLYATSGGNTTIVSSGSTAFSSGPTGSPTFTVTQAGALSSSSGTIGGFTISSTSFSAVSGGNTTTVSSGSTAFSSGPTGSPTFTVTQAGDLTATSGSISGNFTVGGTRLATTIGSSISGAGNFINDLINTKLDTSSKTILGDFTFSPADYSGAFKTGTITWNTSTGAITGGTGIVINKNGIVGASSGNATFSILTNGNATFAGTLSAASGTLGAITIGSNAWWVDSSGNMWWGNYATYAIAAAAGASRISAAGAASFSGLIVGVNVGVGAGSAYAGVITTAYVNALNITTAHLDASSIYTGTLQIGSANQPGSITIAQSSVGTTGLLRWSGGSKIWEDTSNYLGLNSTGERIYFYTSTSALFALFQRYSQAEFYTGVACQGPLNVGSSGSPQNARFTNNVYFDSTGGTSTYIWGNNVHLDLAGPSYISLQVGGVEQLKLGTAGGVFSTVSNVYVNWLRGTGVSCQIGESGTRFYLYGSTVRYTTLTNDSDRSLKENITPISYGLNTVLSLSPVKYKYKESPEYHLGFIAQDIQPIMPELVSAEEETQKLGLSTTEMIPVLVKAVQELSAEIQLLKAK